MTLLGLPAPYLALLVFVLLYTGLAGLASYRRRSRLLPGLVGEAAIILVLTFLVLRFAARHEQITGDVLASIPLLQQSLIAAGLLLTLLLLWLTERRREESSFLERSSLLLPYGILAGVLAAAFVTTLMMYMRQTTLIREHGGPDYASNLFETLRQSLDPTSVTFVYDWFTILLFVVGVLVLLVRSIRMLILIEGLLISMIVMTGLYVQVFNMTLNLEVGYAIGILQQEFSILSFYQFTLIFSVLLAFLLAVFSSVRLVRLNQLAIAEAERKKAEEVRARFIAQQRELERLVKLRTKELAAEHERSERLLHNILPEVIADRLKDDESAIADSFEGTTVLFADIVGFTPFSSQLPPKEVVNLLNTVFTRFDELADQHQLEKIKTIGDAYMVTAGLPHPRSDHAQAAARMALDMLKAIKQLREEGLPPIDLRIGMNSGPVIAGVIGKRKFAYDLWGDVVNTASRMESNGRPGCIQVTEATWELIRNEFDMEPRGEIEIKGKGMMKTWLLNCHRTTTADHKPSPGPDEEEPRSTRDTDV